MKRLRFFVAVAASLTLVAALAGSTLAKSDAARGRTLTATLSGANEVDAAGNPNQGDLGGSGTAMITLNPGQRTVCWTLSFDLSDGQTAFAAHIHRAPAGSNGPIVVPLSVAVPEGTSSGCASVDQGLILEILTNPAGFYANVHSLPTYPGGALRGQLG